MILELYYKNDYNLQEEWLDPPPVGNPMFTGPRLDNPPLPMAGVFQKPAN